MKSVWIVSEGEVYEGSEVLAVCATREGAIRIASERVKVWPFAYNTTRISETEWRGGCDILDIVEHEVLE